MSHPPQMDRIPVKGIALRSRSRQRLSLPVVTVRASRQGGRHPHSLISTNDIRRLGLRCKTLNKLRLSAD